MFFNNILNELDGDSVYGLTPELKGLFLYKKYKKENKSIVCVTSTIYEANKLYQILLNYTDKVSFFPMDDFLTSEALAISPEFKFTRLDTLNTLLEELNNNNTQEFLNFIELLSNYISNQITSKTKSNWENVYKILNAVCQYDVKNRNSLIKDVFDYLVEIFNLKLKYLKAKKVKIVYLTCCFLLSIEIY
jgi:hypothetical protein